MKEQRLVCERCDATATWNDDLGDWLSIEPAEEEIVVHKQRYNRLDFCPSCRFDFEEWMLSGDGDLSESEELYLEGMRLED